MISPFKVGDVVRLSETAMRMIVVGRDDGGCRSFTECSWYDGEGQRNEYAFETTDLELAPVQSGRFPGRRQ